MRARGGGTRASPVKGRETERKRKGRGEGAGEESHRPFVSRGSRSFTLYRRPPSGSPPRLGPAPAPG